MIKANKTHQFSSIQKRTKKILSDSFFPLHFDTKSRFTIDILLEFHVVCLLLLFLFSYFMDLMQFSETWKIPLWHNFIDFTLCSWKMKAQ